MPQATLLGLLEALPGSVEADAHSLLGEVNLLAMRNHGPRTEGVTLASLHQAKGLNETSSSLSPFPREPCPPCTPNGQKRNACCT